MRQPNDTAGRYTWFWLTETPTQEWLPCQAEVTTPALMLGLSVYSSLNWPARFDWFEQHWQRLMHHAGYLGFLQGQGAQNKLREQALNVFNLINQLSEKAQTLRLTCVPIINAFSDYLSSDFQKNGMALGISFRPRVDTILPQDFCHQGLHVKTLPYERPMAFMKHGAIAPELWQRRQANSDDVIWVNASAELTEASTANIALLLPNKTIISPSAPVCLPGLTVSWLADYATNNHWQMRWQPVTPQMLWQGEGLLLSNATCGFRAVSRVDDYALPWPKDLQETVRIWQQSFLNNTQT
ncbi:MAG: aminotransferase class IV [Vampirovibrionales bacterium]|nr:aminotransferase class IV [Vampirovibrionales bacterium]